MADMVFHRKNRMNERQLGRISKLIDAEAIAMAKALAAGEATLADLQEVTDLRALWTAIEKDAEDKSDEEESSHGGALMG